MTEFNRKKSYRKYIYSPLTLFVLFLVLLVLLKAVWGVYSKEQLSAQYLDRERVEFEKIKARQDELAKSVEFLKTEQGVEAEIRSKFRAVKEGESVAVILGNEEATTTDLVAKPEPGIFQKFLGFFGF